jgi:uncharacterized protein (DUF1778 family)
MAKASQKKIDYNNKYNSQNYVRINLSVKPEDADFIKASAKAAGKSMVQYVLDCCKRDVDKA